MIYFIIPILLVSIAISFLFYSIFGFDYVYVGDGAGYNSYLVAKFIYNNMNMDFMSYHPSLSVLDGGKFIQKYPMGVSFLQCPFFLLAHFITKIFNPDELNGISLFYKISILVSVNFYMCFGLILNFKTLRKKFSYSYSMTSLFAIAFGCGMLYYTTVHGSYSHIYSYFLISLFVYLTIKETEVIKFKQLYYIVIGFILGLVFLTRNINILIFIFWIFYGEADLRKRLLKIFSPYIWIAFLLTILPQLIYWHNQTGSYFVNSYGYITTACYLGFAPGCEKEHFDWLTPHFIKNWFHIERGLFIYYPVMLFSVYGLFKLRKYWLNISNGLYFSLLPLVYLITTWYMQSYGWCFGQRCYIDHMTLYSILIACSLAEVDKIENKIYKIILKSFFFILIIVGFILMLLTAFGVIS